MVSGRTYSVLQTGSDACARSSRKKASDLHDYRALEPGDLPAGLKTLGF
jgi:hypothetical protein